MLSLILAKLKFLHFRCNKSFENQLQNKFLRSYLIKAAPTVIFNKPYFDETTTYEFKITASFTLASW